MRFSHTSTSEFLNAPMVEMRLTSNRYLPSYGYVARSHAAAVLNGTIGPVNEELVKVD